MEGVAVFKDQLFSVLDKTWVMLFVFTIIISSIRIAYLLVNREKFVFYKEMLYLFFMLYILVLFYIVTYQDPVSNEISGYNLMPFKEMFRYDFGTPLFYRNIIGNLLLFVPFGIFIPYYLKRASIIVILILSIISSFVIELSQRLIIGRVFDVDDIILNVIGSMIGYLIYFIFDKIVDKIPRFIKKDWLINLFIFILIVLLYLYIFNIDLGLIRGLL